MRADLTSTVYRLYDSWCQPVYFGSSGNVFHRLAAHARADWYSDVGMVLLDWYPNIEIARAVESGLIARDQPSRNVDSRVDGTAPPMGMPPLPARPLRVEWEQAPTALPPAVEIDLSALLADIRDAFGSAPKRSTVDILEWLTATEPWADLLARTSTPARTLAAWLDPLDINAKPMSIPGHPATVRGYLRWQFEPHWLALDTTPPPV